MRTRVRPAWARDGRRRRGRARRRLALALGLACGGAWISARAQQPALPPLPPPAPQLAQIPRPDTRPGVPIVAPQPVVPVMPFPVEVQAPSPAAVTPVSPPQVPVLGPPGPEMIVPTPPVPMPPEPEGPRVVEPRNAVPAQPGGEAPAGSGPALREVTSAREELRVLVGGSKLLQLGPQDRITRVLVDNPRIADIQLLDQEAENPRLINLYGISFGRATLTVWDENDRATSYTVVVGLDDKGLEERIRGAIPGADVTVRQLAAQVILEGQVPDARTMEQVLSLVVSELRLNVATAGSNVVLANAQPAANTSQRQAAMTFGNLGAGGAGGAGGGAGQVGAEPGAGVIVNRVRVPGPRQVLLRVKIAELNRTALRQIGVSWLDARNNAILGSTIGGAGSLAAAANVGQNAAFSPMSLLPGAVSSAIPGRIQAPGFSPVASTFGAAATAATNANSQLFGIFNAGEFNLFINALRGNGLAKILAEPNVVALDGQPASFQAGGEFPYPVPQAATAGGGSVITIEFARFGAILDFLPQIMENDVIRLDVSPTFSELNFSAGFAIPGAGTVPGINSRTARTVVEMREGQTLAIAGLLSTRTTGSTSRVPILGDLPIVGPWFSANRLETVETELVVLVTPELVAPVEAGEVPPGPGEMLLEPNDYEFFFLGRMEGKTGHPHRATVQYLDPFEVMKHVRSEARWVVGPHGHAD